jgi:hypothetical protein
MGGLLGRIVRRAFFPQKKSVTNVYITQAPEEQGTDNLLPLVVLGGLGVLLLTQQPRRRRRRR